MPLRLIELTLLVLVIIGLGVVHFARLTPHQRALIQLEARLEQLYLLEKVHFDEHGRYFDPNDEKIRRAWWRVEGYAWELWPVTEGFLLVVRADLDGDGEIGAWAMDAAHPQVSTLNQD